MNMDYNVFYNEIKKIWCGRDVEILDLDTKRKTLMSFPGAQNNLDYFINQNYCISTSYINSKLKSLTEKGRDIVFFAVKNTNGIDLIPSYKSTDINIENLNSRTTYKRDDNQDEVISCISLAYTYIKESITKGKKYFLDINDINKLHQYTKIIKRDEIVKKRTGKCAKEAHYFSYDSFSRALYYIVNKHYDSEDKSKTDYFLVTPNHTMVIRLKKRHGTIKIIFYDPNKTLIHITFILSNKEYAKHITLNTLFYYSHGFLHSIFYGKLSYVVLLSKSYSAYNNCQVFTYGDSYHSTLLFLSLTHGHFEHQAINKNKIYHNSSFEYLSCYYNGTPGFSNACQYNHFNCVRVFLNLVLNNNNLSPKDKYKFLLAAPPNGKTSFSVICTYCHNESLTTYLDQVLASKLSDDLYLSSKSKLIIIRGEIYNGYSNFGLACCTGRDEFADNFIKKILASNEISFSNKIEILLYGDQPGFFLACYFGYDKLAITFIKYVLTYNFVNDIIVSSKIKVLLLESSNINRISSFHVACERHHFKIVDSFMRLIMSSDHLHYKQKYSLLCTDRSTGCPAFFVICKMGYVDLATNFVNLVLDSYLSNNLDISNDIKFKMLQGLNNEGVSAFDIAYQKGRDSVLESCATILKNTNALYNEQIHILLRLMRKNKDYCVLCSEDSIRSEH